MRIGVGAAAVGLLVISSACTTILGMTDRAVCTDAGADMSGESGRDGGSLSDARPSDGPESGEPESGRTDGGHGDATTADAEPDGAPAARAIVFVTSTTMRPAEIGSTTQADLHCTSLANAQGLPGEFVAWVSSSTSNAIDRLDASRGPWFLTDPNRDAMAFGAPLDPLAGPAVPIGTTEDGGPAPDTVVWTGTDNTGVVTPTSTCEDWTRTSGTRQGAIGRIDGGAVGWTYATTQSCDNAHPIYCFQK
jgi:hypothetical protein